MSCSVRRVAVIMAGGSGERFWPLSRQSRPKQLLHLTSPDETMIEEAVNRIVPMIEAEHVYIATSEALAPIIREAAVGVAPGNVLAEPDKRNTAGCLVWVAAQLRARYPGEEVVMAVLTADHLIGQPARFRGCVERAMAAAQAHPALVTIGVRPDRPETGYGYVEAVHHGNFTAEGARRVASFREKPDGVMALHFLESGHFYWNSGMFFWTLKTFEGEITACSPAHGSALRAIAAALMANDDAAARAAFSALPSISIDYALMEKARQVLMVEADFPWDDVGAWDAMDRSRTADADGNVAEHGPVLLDCRHCIVINDAGEQAMAVGVVGMEDAIVVVAKDAVLVVAKNRAQDVRRIVTELKARKAPQV